MRNIFRFGIMTFAFGLMLFAADTANAQRTGAEREYRRDIREARREYRRDVRRGENRREALREYRDDVRDAQREYVRNVQRTNNGWSFFMNGRRYYRPATQWTYRNGYFYRRY